MSAAMFKPWKPSLVIGMVGLLAACSSTSGTRGSATTGPVAGSPVAVPLTIAGGQGNPAGAKAHISVRIGNGPPVSVVLDSGSVGLHVYATSLDMAAGGGITVPASPHRFTYGYVDGTVFTGEIATATVAIGGVTTSPIPIGVVTSIGCASSKPNCPTAGGDMKARTTQFGTSGVMGIGVDNPGSGIPASPLVSLPGTYGQRWSIGFSGGGGTLTLGSTAPTGAVALTMAGDGSGPGGVRYWNDRQINVCYSFGTVHQCEPTLFDTGNPVMTLFGGALAQDVSMAGSGGTVSPGIPVSLSAASGATFWRFTTGTKSSSDLVVVAPGRGTVNASIAAFYAATLTYDVAAGTLFVHAAQ